MTQGCRRCAVCQVEVAVTILKLTEMGKQAGRLKDGQAQASIGMHAYPTSTTMVIDKFRSVQKITKLILKNFVKQTDTHTDRQTDS